MRKLIAIFLTVIMCFAVCACGGGAAKTKTATVTDQNGETKEMTYKELNDTLKNSAQFDKVYKFAEISFTGTVKEVKTNFTINGSRTVFDNIKFEEGWDLYIDHMKYIMYTTDKEAITDFADVNIGDKLEVSTRIMPGSPMGDMQFSSLSLALGDVYSSSGSSGTIIKKAK